MAGGLRKHPYPSKDVVQNNFDYRVSNEGVALVWRKHRGAVGPGSRAGCKFSSRVNKAPDRYVVKLDGVLFNVRDLIYIYHKGFIPECGLKFADGDCWNLRIENIVPRKPVVSFL